MKMVIRGFALAIIGFMLSLVYLNYTIVDFQETQATYAAQNAIFTTQEAQKKHIMEAKVSDDPVVIFSTTEEYYQDFIDNYLVQITSKNTDVSFELLDADLEKGLFSVVITTKYRNVLGQEKTIVTQKTSIVNIGSEE